mgnify:CR=1 FL=1
MTKKHYAGWYKNKDTKEIHFRNFEDRTLAEIKDRMRCNNSTLICYFEQINGYLSTGRWVNKHNYLNELDNELANYRNAAKDRLGL